MGIGRLIYQLPTTLCEMFLREVFKKNPIDALDQETLFTINKFFENNLNVSETARKLFVHRNTLVYRLEKIKKLTGLDLREFDDAITFIPGVQGHRILSRMDHPPAGILGGRAVAETEFAGEENANPGRFEKGGPFPAETRYNVQKPLHYVHAGGTAGSARRQIKQTNEVRHDSIERYP